MPYPDDTWISRYDGRPGEVRQITAESYVRQIFEYLTDNIDNGDAGRLVEDPLSEKNDMVCKPAIGNVVNNSVVE